MYQSVQHLVSRGVMTQAGCSPDGRNRRKQHEEIEFHPEGEAVKNPCAKSLSPAHLLKCRQVQIRNRTAGQIYGAVDYSAKGRTFRGETIENCSHRVLVSYIALRYRDPCSQFFCSDYCVNWLAGWIVRS